jgi:hypothetical protein
MATGFDNQIVGVCRFSYLGAGGFEASKLDEAALMDLLYDPARMARRFAFFEKLCLPSLAAQTDQGFRLVVLIGTSMPMRFRKRLKGLAERYPFLRICAIEPNGPLNATRRAFRRGTEPGADYITGFRIDDDDAVAVDYIEKTRAVADQLIRLGWADEDNPAVIAFHRGIYWDLNDRAQPFYDFREIGPLGLASAMITRPDARSNMFRWNHRRVAAHARMWSDPTDLMFVRTLHQHNDSGRTIPPGAEPLAKWQGKKILSDRFGLDPEEVLPLMWRQFASDKDNDGE